MMADSQPRHVMHLEKTHASGAEEWHCPTCGRRFLMHWPPDYQKVVIEAGDEYAMHSGSKGDELMYMGSLDFSASDADSESDDLFPPPAGPSCGMRRARQSFEANEAAPSFEADEIDDTPITDELRPWLRGLESLGFDD